jgi:hypothetical protein
LFRFVLKHACSSHQAALRSRAFALAKWLIGADYRQRETKINGPLRKSPRLGNLEIFKRSRRVASYLQIMPGALRGLFVRSAGSSGAN